ncbi:MAG: hypothetical protein ACJAZO_001719 [Myxococcota bacterium]|jgi:hypothetical protein
MVTEVTAADHAVAGQIDAPDAAELASHRGVRSSWSPQSHVWAYHCRPEVTTAVGALWAHRSSAG